MDDWEQLVWSDFGIRVATRLPISESFSSTVISFVGSDGRHYVLKRHWARHKAEREIAALRALDAHPSVPALLATAERDGTVTLLIEGLAGAPWSPGGAADPALSRALGASMAHVHLVPTDSFDGSASWHELLRTNADLYCAVIGDDDAELAARGREVLVRRLDDVPTADTPCLVHFDLRPGNVLVDDGRFVGIIDFEACRGGHASMDFFKLWQQVPDHLAAIVQGYREVVDSAGVAAAWTAPEALVPLMQIYAAYHGLAGLAWCHTRHDFSGEFPAINRDLVRRAVEAR